MSGDVLIPTLTGDTEIAGIALAISLLSILFAYRADRRAEEAKKLAKSADERAARAERRDEERIERERQRAAAAGTARLVIRPTRLTMASADSHRFGYAITNHGEAIARDIRVWLIDENGQDVSIEAEAPFALAPAEETFRYGVTVPRDVNAEDVRFAVSWRDDADGGENLRGPRPIY